MRLLEHLLVLAAGLVRAAASQRPHQVFVPAPLAATRRDLPTGLVQPDRTTCGSACLVVARMLGDPDYARWLETGEVTGRTSVAGTRHRVLAVSPRRRGQAYDDVVGAVALGHAVPLFVGNRTLPRHVVLVVGGDGATLTAYDPASGGSVTITRDVFDRGALRVA